MIISRTLLSEGDSVVLQEHDLQPPTNIRITVDDYSRENVNRHVEMEHGAMHTRVVIPENQTSNVQKRVYLHCLPHAM